MSSSGSKPYDVFLSHGSPDKPWVRALYERLTSAGVVAYLDEVAIGVGENFVSHLSDGIGQASTFVIVVSQETAGRSWVEHEWTSFMATYGPTGRVIPVLLDHVSLPAFLKPYQLIDAVDRDVERATARILQAIGKGATPGATPRAVPYTGRSLTFTIASTDQAEQLVVTSADGTSRTVTPPWRQGNAFGIALIDFEQLTRESALDDERRSRLAQAAQTLGTALFDLLFSDEALRSTFARAAAPGTRAVVTVRSDDDVLLSLPWELLVDESRFLVRDGILDMVRSATGAVQFETQLTPPTEPFTVVTHISAPEGSGLSYEAESFRITHALTDHCPQTATELGTLEDLVETVTRTRPRGIHFSGHGAPGTLVFEDDEGFEDPVGIDRLVTELRKKGDGALPPFFFLASCHGNTPAKPVEGQSGSSSTAAQLHRNGVTEVVGYYGPIADELSTRAEEALYASIAAGQPTRIAVAQARAALQRAFDGDLAHKPAATSNLEPSPARDAAAIRQAAPFAWAQLVFYHRGPEYPLGTPASSEKLRGREAALKRTYRDVADRAFLETGFIGRRRELHQLRRRRRRGDRVFVLQGLGGLGKTTLAGHLLPLLADTDHTVAIWCRRTEGESDQAEAIVGQLLVYARKRFGTGFEEVVGHVDRAAGDDAPQRFAAFLQIILAQQPKVPVVVYFDNLESLLRGPDAVSLETAPDPHAFGAWRADALQRLWRVVVDLANAVENLYVVASCRYRNDDLTAALLPVSPLADADLFRLMAWFPALRRLSTRARAQLAARLSGHPRAVEFLDALVADSVRSWEDANGEWTPPASRDDEAVRLERERLVAPVLPDVQARIWSDLLLAALWDRVLDERARRMLFRMTLLRRPWDEGLLVHLGEPEDNADAAGRTARTLANTSLLEQIMLTVTTPDGQIRRPFWTIHAATAAFVKSRFGDASELVAASHLRIGTYLEEQARTSRDLSVDLEAGYHLFEAGKYDRAYELLGSASDLLRGWGRVREGLQILLPFLAESVQRRMQRLSVGRLLGTIGLAYLVLGETRRAIDFYERRLVIAREIDDRRGEGNALGNLGIAYANLGETRRAIGFYEQQIVITREIGDRLGEGNALGNLGNAYRGLGEIRRAIEHHEQALVISREVGNRRTEGQDLGSLGNAYSAAGETRRAIEHYEKALVISRESGDRSTEGAILGNLGVTYAALGETRRAIDFHQQQLAIVREIGDRRGAANALGGLGNAYNALGETRRAIDFHEQGLVISREIGDRRGEGNAVGNLGIAYAALGETQRAINSYEQQLVIVREIGDRRGEGNALANSGNAYVKLGDTGRAIDFYKQGLAIGQAISDPRIISVCEAGLKRCGAAS